LHLMVRMSDGEREKSAVSEPEANADTHMSAARMTRLMMVVGSNPLYMNILQKCIKTRLLWFFCPSPAAAETVSSAPSEGCRARLKGNAALSALSEQVVFGLLCGLSFGCLVLHRHPRGFAAAGRNDAQPHVAAYVGRCGEVFFDVAEPVGFLHVDDVG